MTNPVYGQIDDEKLRLSVPKVGILLNVIDGRRFHATGEDSLLRTDMTTGQPYSSRFIYNWWYLTGLLGPPPTSPIGPIA